MRKNTLIRYCVRCKATTIFDIIGTYVFHREELATDILYKEECSLLKCINCSRPMVEQLNTTYENYYNPNDELEYEKIIDDAPPTFITLYPVENTTTITPEPAKDMPKDIKDDFNEARKILDLSPRSSAALLRLVIQKLCIHLGQPGKKIDDDIAALVRRGLTPEVQQSLDIIRVIGNNAVHPGTIDLQDNKSVVLDLFNITNFIVEEMISKPKKPKKISEMFDGLPEGAREHIKVRDKNTKSIN